MAASRIPDGCSISEEKFTEEKFTEEKFTEEKFTEERGALKC